MDVVFGRHKTTQTKVQHSKTEIKNFERQKFKANVLTGQALQSVQCGHINRNETKGTKVTY